MKNIIHEYISYSKKLKFNQEITKHIFDNLDIEKYIKMMNYSNNIKDNNMNRMFISYFRDNLLAYLLNMKYVGDKKEWETDCIYPKNVKNPNQFHIKYEIKIQKKMFLRNGNSNGIILKNGRGEGSKIKNLLKSIYKNNFLLINSTFPYDIAYVQPQNFLYYSKSKKNAKTLDQIINDDYFLNDKYTELSAYVKKENITYVYKYDYINHKSYNYKYFYMNESFNPLKNIIKHYIYHNF